MPDYDRVHGADGGVDYVAFSPEFLNRVDGVLVFGRLGPEAIRSIVDIQLRRVEELLTTRGMTLEVTAAARDELAALGYDPAYGARPLRRVIQEKVLKPLSALRRRWNSTGEPQGLSTGDLGIIDRRPRDNDSDTFERGCSRSSDEVPERKIAGELGEGGGLLSARKLHRARR